MIFKRRTIYYAPYFFQGTLTIMPFDFENPKSVQSNSPTIERKHFCKMIFDKINYNSKIWYYFQNIKAKVTEKDTFKCTNILLNNSVNIANPKTKVQTTKYSQ